MKERERERERVRERWKQFFANFKILFVTLLRVNWFFVGNKPPHGFAIETCQIKTFLNQIRFFWRNKVCQNIFKYPKK